MLVPFFSGLIRLMFAIIAQQVIIKEQTDAKVNWSVRMTGGLCKAEDASGLSREFVFRMILSMCTQLITCVIIFTTKADEYEGIVD